jgi:hypothetical protein
VSSGLRSTSCVATEWIYCRRKREWALERLGVELKALEFFTAGSGLGPPP